MPVVSRNQIYKGANGQQVVSQTWHNECSIQKHDVQIVLLTYHLYHTSSEDFVVLQCDGVISEMHAHYNLEYMYDNAS